MHIILYQPEIPQNTGNIARTCAVTGTTLHLVGPLGFSTEDRYLKRAGLDYWQLVKICYWENIEQLHQTYPRGRFFFVSTRGGHPYHSISYKPEDFLVFGSETSGLPRGLLQSDWGHSVRIPMLPGTRSLNLSNAVALTLYETLRQQGFPGFV